MSVMETSQEDISSCSLESCFHGRISVLVRFVCSIE